MPKKPSIADSWPSDNRKQRNPGMAKSTPSAGAGDNTDTPSHTSKKKPPAKPSMVRTPRKQSWEPGSMDGC